MEVIKTLVIGLGSSGIEVCDRLIERIRWELGDVRRAPWVRFLGIETNQTVDTDLRDMGDLLLLTITANEYSLLLAGHADYEQILHLNQWANLELLRMLPSNEVTAGAGNIRMVGRLVFFYRYNEVAHEVSRRLNDLRNLTSAEAMAIRGELWGGENPPLTFTGSIRIFVVGTLCGGTCSGMVSDFGFFLRLLTRPDERIIGMFTLPSPHLTIAIDPRANRYKKNAYTALVELNHYHLVHRNNPSIIFPDGRYADTSQAPYDHPYLLFPEGITRDDLQKLHQLMADRIFLNIFAPGTDSFRRTVDAPQVGGGQEEDIIRGDRFHRAHVFLSVGIATMEYPAERIIAACTSRQLAYTLGHWNSRAMAEGEVASRLRELGLEWDKLCEWLFHTPSGESIDGAVRRRVEDIVDLATVAPEQARRQLGELRQAFENQGIIPAPPNQELYRGAVISTCLQNKEYALGQFRSAVRVVVQRDLLDYYVGPAALRDLMARARNRLAQLLQQRSPDISEAADRVNRLLEKIERCRRSRKLGITGLKRKELRRLRSELRKALNEEIVQRLNSAAMIALRDLPLGQYGGEQQGLISMLTRETDILERRLNHLVSRVARQRELFDREDYKLSHDEPQIAGVMLFKPDPDGTVTEEYRRCLEESAEQGVTWQQQREALAGKIIRAWGDLVERVIPPGGIQPQEDWLDREFRPQVDEPFPRSLLEPIINTARDPFLRILRSDVFEKWWQFYNDPGNRNEHAREVFRRVIPSVRIDRYLAERGRSPIAIWSVLALPPQGSHRQDFLNAIRGAAGFPMNCEYAESPFSYRLFMLQEWHRWPLSGVPDITMPPNGLCAAECGDFPSFHTRKDVAWIPLTDDEVKNLDKAYRLLVMGVLCGFVIPRQGALEIEHGLGLLGEATWRLPLSLDAAARQIAIIGRDLNNQYLDTVETVLEGRLIDKRAECGSDEAFIRFLTNQLSCGCGTEIPDWNVNESERVVVKYCGMDTQLRQALMRVKPLPEEVKRNLWRNEGDPRPRGGYYNEPGYYCNICGGLIGRTEEEALQNGWCCYVNPDHCFYNLEP